MKSGTAESLAVAVTSRLARGIVIRHRAHVDGSAICTSVPNTVRTSSISRNNLLDLNPMETIPPWLDHLFDELNTNHFGGALARPKFLVNRWGGQFANYVPQVHFIFMHPRTLNQDRKFVADTLLHELVHYALELRTGGHAPDHGAPFVELANEIGAALRLPAVTLGTDAVLEWPQSVRPADYAPWR